MKKSRREDPRSKSSGSSKGLPRTPARTDLARRDAVAAYAAEAAGSPLDLDPDLERAGVEHLLQTTAGWD